VSDPALVAVTTAILSGHDLEAILSHVLSQEEEPEAVDFAFRDRSRVKRAARLASRLIAPNRRTVEGRSTGPAGEWTRRTYPARQAAYLLTAARRLAVDVPNIEAERRFTAQHLTAETTRVQAAIVVDRLSSIHGRVLGWNSVRDEITTPGCRAAHGRNFLAAAPPMIEGLPSFPGTQHGGACRCQAVPPWPQGELLPPAGIPPARTV
jgi:hypothetical protein